MLIRRCAWHRSYHGYPFAFGIASWRGLRVSFTDGMCLGCTARFRREWKLPEVQTRRAAPGWATGLARAALVVFVVASFTPASHRLDDARTRGTMTAPPKTVLVSPVPFEEEPMPALAIAKRPGRTRTNASMVARGGARRPTLVARATFAAPSRSIAPASPTVVSIADSVVSVADLTPAVIPSVTMASPAMESIVVGVVVASVPHAGLMHQAP